MARHRRRVLTSFPNTTIDAMSCPSWYDALFLGSLVTTLLVLSVGCGSPPVAVVSADTPAESDVSLDAQPVASPDGAPDDSLETQPDTELTPTQTCGEWVGVHEVVPFPIGVATVDSAMAQRLREEFVPRIVSRDDILVVRINGHAYEREPEPYELAERRAQAVRDILIAEGVPAELLEIHNYGSEHIMIGITVDWSVEQRRVTFNVLLARLPRPEHCVEGPP